LVVATHNADKVREVKEALRLPPAWGFELSSLEDQGVLEVAVEDGPDLYTNAWIKATHAFARTQTAVLSDDTGLEVAALNNEPGVFSARYAGANASADENTAKLLELMAWHKGAARAARFVCEIAFIDADGSELAARGVCTGHIAESPRGTGGFGYDPVFIPDEIADGRSFAELSADEKNAISHRGRALNELRQKLLAKYPAPSAAGARPETGLEVRAASGPGPASSPASPAAAAPAAPGSPDAAAALPGRPAVAVPPAVGAATPLASSASWHGLAAQASECPIPGIFPLVFIDPPSPDEAPDPENQASVNGVALPAFAATAPAPPPVAPTAPAASPVAATAPAPPPVAAAPPAPAAAPPAPAAAPPAPAAAPPAASPRSRKPVELAVFDFDGTLLDGHSPVRLVRRLLSARLLPLSVGIKVVIWGLRYKLRRPVEQEEVRSLIFGALGHVPDWQIKKIMIDLYHQELRPLLRVGGLAELGRQREAGRQVVIISASFRAILTEFSHDIQANQIICTEMEVVDDAYTGRVSGLVPEGIQKLILLRGWADGCFGEGKWCLSTAFADHYSDERLLSAAVRPVTICPDRVLEQRAKKLHWAIDDWRQA